MIWNPPAFLKGAAVAVLGGGPSLTVEQVKAVRSAGYRVIGVNDAYLFGNDVDICFWGDPAWYFGNDRHEGHMKPLERFYGIKATCAPECVEYPGVHGLIRRLNPGLWPTPCCRWYRNSGFSAVGLAVTLGAVKIVLLGFDGQANGTKTHWHPDAVETPDLRVFREHHKSAQELMDDIADYPGGKGVRVLNCSPDSAYAAFEQDTLQNVIGYSK